MPRKRITDRPAGRGNAYRKWAKVQRKMITDATATMECVFNTKKQAERRQEKDYTHYISWAAEAGQDSGAAWYIQTQRWAKPRQRNDGKWTYPACGVVDYEGTGVKLEPHDPTSYLDK
jgi:hypothetical protein